MGNEMAKCSQRISWDVSSCHKLKIGAFVMGYQFYNIHALWDTFNASINIWEDLWLLAPRIKQDGINFMNIKFKSAFVKNNILARIRIWPQEVRLVKFSIQSSQRWSKRKKKTSQELINSRKKHFEKAWIRHSKGMIIVTSFKQS